MFFAQDEDAYQGTIPATPDGNIPHKTGFDSYARGPRLSAERPPRAKRGMQLQL